MTLPPWLFLLVPPVAGGIIGYFTNDLAIKMLFRPYRARYVGQQRLPFTPGLIPRNQERLARRVADTIVGSLLTPAELQKIARRLLDIDRVRSALQWLLRLALEQIQGDRQAKTVHILADILRDLMGESMPRLLKAWSRREDFLQDQLNHLFDRVLLEWQLTSNQARRLSQWLVDVIAPPNALRLTLIDFLTDDNIHVVDASLREHTTGPYWVVANVVGVRSALVRLRSFCLEDPVAANQQLAELMEKLRVRDRLYDWLRVQSLQNLPVSTVRQLRRTLRESVRTYAQERGTELLYGLNSLVDWERVAELSITRIQNSIAVRDSLEPISGELAVVFDRYLERDLESLIAKIIPILDLDRVIVDRIKDTRPEDLETAVQGIVKSELQAIVNLGGVLGLLIGCLQTLILALR